MTWPDSVDGPEQVAPGSSYSQVRLVDVPAIPDDVPAGAGRLGELRSEPMDPPVDRDVVDLDPSLGEELFDVPIGKAEPQVPPDRQGDDLGREPEPSEGRAWGRPETRVRSLSHGASVPDAAPSRPMQQCPHRVSV